MPDQTFPTTITELLKWILTGGGAGIVAYALMEWIPAIQEWSQQARRFTALALTALLAVGAYALSLWMALYTKPDTPQAWLSELFSIIAVAIVTSQSLHGATKLSTKKKG